MLGRTFKTLGGLIGLLTVYVLYPAGFVIFGGNPFATIAASAHTSLLQDNGTLFLACLAIFGWCTWFYFVIGFLVGIIARLSGRNMRLPGFGPAQAVAALMLAAITTTAAAPALSSARTVATVSHAQPPPAIVVASQDQPTATGDQKDAPAPTSHMQVDESSVTHQVQARETLIDLAELYYDNPNATSRIVEANIGVVQPDGRSLQTGHTRIYTGWTLIIPGPTSHQTAPEAVKLAAVTAKSAPQIYQTQRGDYLWHIAERYLGDPERYPEIAACNPGLISDPDAIEPGWQLTLPDDAHDSGSRRHATGHTIASPAIDDSAEQPPSSPATQLPNTQPAPSATPAAETPEQSNSEAVTSADTDDQEHEQSAVHVSLPSGGWITAGFAVALTTALVLGQLQRRRKAKPQFPIPITHTPAGPPLSDSLRVAASAGLTLLREQNEMTEHQTLTPPRSHPVSSIAITSAGTEVGLHHDLTGLTCLAGPGSHAAARAIVAAALASSLRQWGKDQAEVVIDFATLTQLLESDNAPASVQRLTVLPDTDASLKALEGEVIYRTDYLNMYDAETITELHDDTDRDPLELHVWIGTADTLTAPRIQQAAEQGTQLGIDVFLLGELPGQPAIHIAEDGTVTTPAGHTAHPILDHGRVATLTPADFQETLGILTDTANSNHDHETPTAAEAVDMPVLDDAGGDLDAVPEATWEAASPELLAPARHHDAPVSLRVLGSLSMSTAEVPHINFGRSYAYPMLALLAAHPQGRTLEQLIIGVGLDKRPGSSKRATSADPEEDARLQIQADKDYARSVINSGIRPALKGAGGRDGKVHLRYEGTRYKLNPDTVEVDLWRMHAHLADANDSVDDQAALSSLRQAVASYQGDFAEEVDMMWANDQRDLYRSQVLDAYHKIVELIEEDQPDLALAHLRDAIEIDPVNETLYQMAMRIQGRLRRADAVDRTMTQLQDRLAERMGNAIEPNLATQGVYRRMIKLAAEPLSA